MTGTKARLNMDRKKTAPGKTTEGGKRQEIGMVP